ncbi:MAG TPA: hypothetical protein VKW76_06865 [Candidatus Binatia bacterium]|nr:hypothetical protein [Candidatus Binatia bacterium]
MQRWRRDQDGKMWPIPGRGLHLSAFYAREFIAAVLKAVPYEEAWRDARARGERRARGAVA